MGLFSLLFGGNKGPKFRPRTRVWLTERAKTAGILATINQATDAMAIILVAHFPDTLGRLQTVIDRQSSEGVPVMAALAANLTKGSLPAESDRLIEVIVAERHPILEMEEPIRKFQEAFSNTCKLQYELSLEDPVMRLLVGERVVALLRKLGMKENEPIESPQVHRRLTKGLEWLSRRRIGNRPADSAEEWLQLNFEHKA